MRRGGRIVLFLVVVIVILVAVTFLVLGGGFLGALGLGGPTPAPTVANKTVYVVGQPINRDDPITAEALSTIQLPETLVHEWMVTDPAQVVGKYAAFPLKQGMILSPDMFTERPGMVGVGSEAARVISPGLVAISMPINRLNSVAYAIHDGDRVNIIATTLFVDLDAGFQSILPNNLGVIQPPGPVEPRVNIVVGGSEKYGRVELDPTLNQPVYVLPSEGQRPRLVSQMVLQDIQVLHVGAFSLVDQSGVQPTAEPGQPVPTAAPVANPDIITLIVTPQDAISLTYFMYGNTQLTLTLRAPDDTTRAETEAATLQYILSQYAIPVPAKLPYAIQPRIDILPVYGTPAPN